LLSPTLGVRLHGRAHSSRTAAQVRSAAMQASSSAAGADAVLTRSLASAATASALSVGSASSSLLQDRALLAQLYPDLYAGLATNLPADLAAFTAAADRGDDEDNETASSSALWSSSSSSSSSTASAASPSPAAVAARTVAYDVNVRRHIGNLQVMTFNLRSSLHEEDTGLRDWEVGGWVHGDALSLPRKPACFDDVPVSLSARFQSCSKSTLRLSQHPLNSNVCPPPPPLPPP
jgi:hypothetical protein